MTSLNCWFGSVCLAELRRNPSATLEELIATVDEYRQDSLKEQVRGAYRSILCRAQACIEAGGGASEYKLKKDWTGHWGVPKSAPVKSQD